MIVREEDGLWSVLHETIASHHEDVFACLTTEAGIMQWFSVAAQIDLRPGGTIVFGWDAKFRKKTTIAILDYDPGGRIVWDWYAQHLELHAPLYWTVTPAVEEGSRIELRQGPFREEIEPVIAMADEVESWRWYLSNLRSVLESRHDMRKVRPL